MASIGEYEVGELLGEGSFGSVWECTVRESGERRAIKIIEAVHAKRHGGLQAANRVAAARRAPRGLPRRRAAARAAPTRAASAPAVAHAPPQAVMTEKAVLIHLDSPGHANIIRLHATFRSAVRMR